MIYRKKLDALSDRRLVLDAMGRCRRVLIDASSSVQPFGTTDGLAKFLTGDETYYHAGGSTYGSDATKWRDSGSGR